MLAALPRQWEVWTESMDGRLVCVMDWATFMTFCSSLQSWAEQEPGEKPGREVETFMKET